MLLSSRVLKEMSGLGFAATELGAPGFLPESADGITAELGSYGMTLLGAFTPFVFHQKPERESALGVARETAQFLQRAGATTLISSVVQDLGWSHPQPLSNNEMVHMAEMFDRVDDICQEFGLQQVLRPHVQTVVETKDDISRVLDACDVGFCLDTGHMAFGGQDPVEFARDAFDRVGHVHRKDIRLDMTAAGLRREISLMEATQAGISPHLVREMLTSRVLFRPSRRRDIAAGMSLNKTPPLPMAFLA